MQRTRFRLTAVRITLIAAGIVAAPMTCAAISVAELGVKPDGEVDCTKAVQNAMDAGNQDLFFPAGTYLTGSLSVPSETTINCSAGATFLPNPETITDRTLIKVTGDGVTLRGFTFTELNSFGADGDQPARLISADGVGALRVTDLTVTPESQCRLDGVHIEHCRDIEVDHCEVKRIENLVKARWCRRVSVHENRATNCRHVTLFSHGCRQLRHYANHSSHVKHQCQWWGGDANDTHGWVPDNTADVVRRNIGPDDNGYQKHTTGVYDITIENNYAEYGKTLAWGSKGRNVVIDGNIARFMSDMAYDTEGTANVVISNNIAINAQYFGIGCYFWTERALITGNLVSVLEQDEERYRGNFLRLHGPGSADHFGAGRTHVTGNTFVNECSGLRGIVIEACRDITIANNTLNNGFIRTINSSRRVTVTANTFEWAFAADRPAIIFAAGVKHGIARNNTLRCLSSGDTNTVQSAIVARAGDGALRILESNVITGWSDAITCGTSAGESAPRFFVRDNTLDGSILLPADEESHHSYCDDNLDMDSMEAVVPETMAK